MGFLGEEMMMKNTNTDSISTAHIDLPRLCSRDVHTGDTSLLLKEQNLHWQYQKPVGLVCCFLYMLSGYVLFCLSLASVSDEQSCLLKDWQSVYRISGSVSLGQACTQNLI